MNVTNSRIPAVEFAGVFFADDTILFSTKPRAHNELLKHMENCSERYGLKINRRKCHTLHMHREASIHFQDNTVLHKAHDATYLGNSLNCKVNLAREVTQRIQDTKRTLQKLKVYWKKSSAGKKWQLIIYDAVIRSKLLYNLETMCLTQSLRKKLDTFHLRGLGKKSFKYPRHTSIGGIRRHVFMSWLLKLLIQMILIKVSDLFLQCWMRSELT